MPDKIFWIKKSLVSSKRIKVEISHFVRNDI